MNTHDLFYNTTHEQGEQLEKFRIVNRTRNAEILALFERRIRLSPSQVWVAMRPRFSGIPITSVRRGITDLTSAGMLRKTADKREGMFGRSEFIWEIV